MTSVQDPRESGGLIDPSERRPGMRATFAQLGDTICERHAQSNPRRIVRFPLPGTHAECVSTLDGRKTFVRRDRFDRYVITEVAS